MRSSTGRSHRLRRPRLTLEPKRGPRLGRKLLPVGLDRPPLDGAQADGDPVLALEVLAHDVGIASVPVKPLPQPGLKPVELARPPRHGERPPATRRHVAPHRRPAAPELSGQPPRPPAQQPHRRRHLVRLQHDLPPRFHSPQRACHSSILHSPPLVQRGPVLGVVRGSVLRVARQAYGG